MSAGLRLPELLGFPFRHSTHLGVRRVSRGEWRLGIS